MQYIRELAEYNGNGRAAVTFGKFDGLHRGHQMLVTKVRELGKQENINSIVCSFDMRPLWKEKGIAPELLMVGEERQERVKDEVDYLIECPFTESFRQKSAEDFIQEIIHDLFRAKYIVVGTDFTFGCEKRGDVHMLAEYADQYDYELIVSCCTYILHLENGKIQEQYVLDEKGIQRLKTFFYENEVRPYEWERPVFPATKYEPTLS